MAGRIESSRKHGPFDPRFPKTPKLAVAPAAKQPTATPEHARSTFRAGKYSRRRLAYSDAAQARRS
jgi:hypothetical protein